MKKTKEISSKSPVHGKRPEKMHNHFLALSAVSFFVILVFVSSGIYLILSDHIISEARSDSLKIADLINANERDLFTAKDANGKEKLSITTVSFPELDIRMKHYLKPLGMFRIKIYDTSRKIVYSTDHDLIGGIDPDNADLIRVLRGDVVERIVKQETIMDLEGKERLNADVVKTYIPIQAAKSRILGVFEIYSDVTEPYGALRNVMLSTVVYFSLVLLIVFGILVFFMRSAAKRLVNTRRELDNLSLMDALTRTYKKEHVIERGESEYIRARREQSKECLSSNLSVIMVDIDRFFEVNTRGGRMAGDVVLRDVSERIKSAIRRYDVLGRFGGEEFIILLPNSDFEDAFHIAQRIWKKVRETEFSFGDKNYSLTVSLGVASSRDEDVDFSDILQRAHEGLDQAKKHGADRIENV